MGHFLPCISVVFVLLFHSSRGDDNYTITLERGQEALFGIGINSTVTNASWYDVTGTTPALLTSCSVSSGTCNHTKPAQYQGLVGNSTGNRTVSLHIYYASTTATKFEIIANTGQSRNCTLFVYVWPAKPYCSMNTTEEYLYITCHTDDVYPKVNATLFRRQSPMLDLDVDNNFTQCTLGDVGPQGNLKAQCQWRLYKNRLQAVNTFYVGMSAYFSNNQTIDRDPVYSADFNCTLTVERDHYADFGFILNNNNITNASWYDVTGTTPVLLTSCTVSSRNCTDTTSLYQGQFDNSTGSLGVWLVTLDASITSTKFQIQANTGQSRNCTLYVYVWPAKPRCSMNTTEEYLYITCHTDAVYPKVNATLFRRQSPVLDLDVDNNFTQCTLGDMGPKGDYSAQCQWRLYKNRLQPVNTFYVGMGAYFSANHTLGRALEYSDNFPSGSTRVIQGLQSMGIVLCAVFAGLVSRLQLT